MPQDRHTPRSEDTVWIDVDIISETPKAWLLSDSKVKDWVPKSQIVDWEDEPQVGDSNRVEIPTWLAEEKGFS